MDFLTRFNSAVKKIDATNDTVKPKPQYVPIVSVAHLSRFRLVTIYNGRRKIIAHGLTRYEASILQKHAETKLRKTREPDGTGKTLFEVTEILVEEII